MAKPPSWAEPSVPYPKHGVSLVVLQGIREYSFLGTEHHPRAQRSPCGARGALPWESKINQSWHHQLMPPRAIGTAWCHTSKQLPLPTAGRHTAAAHCQCHHVPTRRQEGNLDYLVPSLGISSCSFLKFGSPRTATSTQHGPASPPSSSCFPPNSAPPATNARSSGQDGQAGTCTRSRAPALQLGRGRSTLGLLVFI